MLGEQRRCGLPAEEDSWIDLTTASIALEIQCG